MDNENTVEKFWKWDFYMLEKHCTQNNAQVRDSLQMDLIEEFVW